MRGDILLAESSSPDLRGVIGRSSRIRVEGKLLSSTQLKFMRDP